MTAGLGAAVGGPPRVGDPLERLAAGPVGVPGRCAPSAERRGDTRFGTASPTPRWLLVEQPGGWGPEALLDSTLDRAVGAELVRRWEDGAGIRVLLIRRPGRRTAPVRKAWAVVDSRAGRERVGWGSWTDPAELLDLPVGAGGRAAGRPALPGLRARPARPLLRDPRPAGRRGAGGGAARRGLGVLARRRRPVRRERGRAAARPVLRARHRCDRGATSRPRTSAARCARTCSAAGPRSPRRPRPPSTTPGSSWARPGWTRCGRSAWPRSPSAPGGSGWPTRRARCWSPSGPGWPRRSRLTCGSTRAERPRSWELVALRPG